MIKYTHKKLNAQQEQKANKKSMVLMKQCSNNTETKTFMKILFKSKFNVINCNNNNNATEIKTETLHMLIS